MKPNAVYTVVFSTGSPLTSIVGVTFLMFDEISVGLLPG